jgi:hypothetical protein
MLNEPIATKVDQRSRTVGPFSAEQSAQPGNATQGIRIQEINYGNGYYMTQADCRTLIGPARVGIHQGHAVVRSRHVRALLPNRRQADDR